MTAAAADEREAMDQPNVWDAAYADSDEHRSWTQEYPARSLEAIQAVAPSLQAPIVDVGGGSSRLAGSLIATGYTDVTVLDLSAAALELARGRLGDDADRVRWVTGDLLAWRPDRRYAVWHDRAVLHFFTDPADRAAYVSTLHDTLLPGGHAVIATFAPDGPDRCSGLPVQRSSSEAILELLGHEFTLAETSSELHRTPSGHRQPFTWVTARRAI